MAMPRKIPVDFGLVFPHGVWAVGEVTPVRDYDRSTRDNIIQAADADTGLLMWQVDVIDGDPEVRKTNRTVSVKICAKVQPVLPEAAPGVPFRPVEFDKLTATPYVDQNGEFSRLAWSYRAMEVRQPSKSRPAPVLAGEQKASA
ncbi:plasmid replication, integration and excision activator [Nocardioides bruguierae]|uniref:Plasmid replication, integration and excision activator n=1 Tax=Nocardioides bruguierae TaxID=2945102 RepID=A0A9X2IHS3_9ACTN|nr:plasmid replication, integration and excision activator [Nocardioides bruguierae]MCM0622884.1 plasmid replication, integration and excision activator [Nocardioides bruguierae]